jgi:hypothetical protein
MWVDTGFVGLQTSMREQSGGRLCIAAWISNSIAFIKRGSVVPYATEDQS